VYLGGGGLGYQRGVTEALLTATELAEAIRAITERVDVNVIVDGGVGFGDPVHLARAIRLFEQAGAAGVEIEDQVAPKRVHHHKGVEHLVSSAKMVDRIRAAVDARRDDGFVIIARCNAVAHEGVQAALDRATAYADAGADLLMLFPRSADESRAVSAGTTLPLAAMFMGEAQDAAELTAVGYSLSVDAMSATALTVRALSAGYAALRTGAGIGLSEAAILATVHEAGEAIGIEALYAIETRTTERVAAQ
jgi:methylisocitrate lyase